MHQCEDQNCTTGRKKLERKLDNGDGGGPSRKRGGSQYTLNCDGENTWTWALAYDINGTQIRTFIKGVGMVNHAVQMLVENYDGSTRSAFSSCNSAANTMTTCSEYNQDGAALDIDETSCTTKQMKKPMQDSQAWKKMWKSAGEQQAKLTVKSKAK